MFHPLSLPYNWKWGKWGQNSYFLTIHLIIAYRLCKGFDAVMVEIHKATPLRYAITLFDVKDGLMMKY
jgi:hypothetical protein